MRFSHMYRYIVLYCFGLLVLGCMMDSPADIWDGLIHILANQDYLITDYMAVAGPGAALVNTALVTLTSVGLLFWAKDTLNGFTFVEVGLVSGFALFGKNIFNIFPFFIGVWLYAKLQKEPFSKYVGVAVLGTALSPLVSYVSMGSENAHIIGGISIGIGMGFVLPSLSGYTFKIQNGMNLYNMGFACGLLGLVLMPIFSGLEDTPEPIVLWATEYNVQMGSALIVFSFILVLSGFFACETSPRESWKSYCQLLNTSGRAPSDFLRMYGSGAVLINMGVNCFAATSFILLSGGDINGPTMGGVFTIVGFSAYGKHIRNIVPVSLGVVLGSVFFHFHINDPGVQLASLFCTALAPFTGVFGWPIGILAGFIHSALVFQTAGFMSGMNLYNNGFSTGLLAIVLYPIITSIIRRRQPELQYLDLFKVFQEDAPQTNHKEDSSK